VKDALPSGVLLEGTEYARTNESHFMRQPKTKMDICLRILAELAPDTATLSDSFIAAILDARSLSCITGTQHALIPPVACEHSLKLGAWSGGED
jgi:hypothetical protein